jgi:hypothetical protein
VVDAGAVQHRDGAHRGNQGGTAREYRVNELSTEVVDAAPWVVTTREVWEGGTPEARARLDVVAEVRGLAYAARGRVVEVIVLRRRDEAESGTARPEDGTRSHERNPRAD